MFFILNLILWIKQSSAAIPFTTLLALLALWFGISVPLTFVGAYFGFKKRVSGGKLIAPGKAIFKKKSITVFLLSAQKRCCGFSSVAPQWGTSDECPKHVFMQKWPSLVVQSHARLTGDQVVTGSIPAESRQHSFMEIDHDHEIFSTIKKGSCQFRH